MSEIIVRRDLRGRFGAARDQGGRETCLAFALSDTHAAARGLPWSPLSCEYLFYHAKQRDKTPPHGGPQYPRFGRLWSTRDSRLRRHGRT